MLLGDERGGDAVAPSKELGDERLRARQQTGEAVQRRGISILHRADRPEGRRGRVTRRRRGLARGRPPGGRVKLERVPYGDSEAPVRVPARVRAPGCCCSLSPIGRGRGVFFRGRVADFIIFVSSSAELGMSDGGQRRGLPQIRARGGRAEAVERALDLARHLRESFSKVRARRPPSGARENPLSRGFLPRAA